MRFAKAPTSFAQASMESGSLSSSSFQELTVSASPDNAREAIPVGSETISQLSGSHGYR